MATYFLDKIPFSAATSVYTDIGLNVLAPDGYYSFSDVYRQQTGGLLGPTFICTINTIIANDDNYSAYVTVGINGNNILANDTLGGLQATTSNVVITQLSTSNPSVNINTSTGAVVVGTGVAVGSYLITYKICEIGNIANCDTANVGITINPLPYNYCMGYGMDCTVACNGSLTSVAYNVKSGSPICVDGLLEIGGYVFDTIYSPDTPLKLNSLLYSDSGLTNTIEFGFIQLTTQANIFAVIFAGQIYDVYSVNSSCLK